MGNRAKLVIALLLLLAALLAVAAFFLSQPSRKEIARTTATTTIQRGVPVVVAKRLLVAGEPITDQDLEVLSYPTLPTGAFSHRSALIGKTPAVNIAAQVPLLGQNLIAGLATHIAPDHVAMAVAANPILAVGYHLHPGDWVDVFGILPGNQQSMQGGWPTQSRLLLPHLRVLAVGPVTVSHAQPATQHKNDASMENNSQQPPRTIVLQVPVASANTLALASQEGRLLLALQNPKNPTAPDISAFPTPSPAILPSKLPYAQQHQALQKPENRAYAGETLPGLAGKSVQEAARMRALAPPPAPTVQVIAGGHVSRVPY
jgi:pilus assembly protein CpaB